MFKSYRCIKRWEEEKNGFFCFHFIRFGLVTFFLGKKSYGNSEKERIKWKSNENDIQVFSSNQPTSQHLVTWYMAFEDAYVCVCVNR